jgi:hypothetical protein
MMVSRFGITMNFPTRCLAGLAAVFLAGPAMMLAGNNAAKINRWIMLIDGKLLFIRVWP